MGVRVRWSANNRVSAINKLIVAVVKKSSLQQVGRDPKLGILKILLAFLFSREKHKFLIFFRIIFDVCFFIMSNCCTKELQERGGGKKYWSNQIS